MTTTERSLKRGLGKSEKIRGARFSHTGPLLFFLFMDFVTIFRHVLSWEIYVVGAYKKIFWNEGMGEMYVCVGGTNFDYFNVYIYLYIFSI